MTRFSVIIPCKNDSPYLQDCLKHLKNMTFTDYEIIIIPDSKISIRGVKVIPLKSGPADKRDLGVKNAKGEYIAFIDDDAYPDKNWLSTSLKYFKDNVVAVGGPQITPKEDSFLQRSSGRIFSSFLVGGLKARYTSLSKSFFVDDWPTVNFIIKKSVFIELGGFDSHYYPGEDTKLCLDLINAGYKISYAPDCIVYHHRRKLFKEHLKQVSNYGIHRGLFVKKFPKTSFRLNYFIPSIITLFLLSSIFFVLTPLFNFYLTVLILYLSICFLFSISFKDPLTILPTSLGIILTHFFYGIYFIKGLIVKEVER